MMTSVSNVMVIREEKPLNLECPFRTLDGLITPINQFFVRTHFPMPVIDAIRRVLAVAGVFLLAAGSWSAHPRARGGDSRRDGSRVNWRRAVSDFLPRA